MFGVTNYTLRWVLLRFFPVIIISNRTYVAPACRESEFPRTRVLDLEIAPTEDAMSDSPEYSSIICIIARIF